MRHLASPQETRTWLCNTDSEGKWPKSLNEGSSWFFTEHCDAFLDIAFVLRVFLWPVLTKFNRRDLLNMPTMLNVLL